MLGWKVPCHETIRSWVLRLGLFLLRRPLQKADDWLFIFDHTTSLGKRNCLLILGIRLSTLSSDAFAPQHHNVVVLDLAVSDKADAEHVHQRLQAACSRVGVPRQIVSDHASNLVKAIALFQEDHPEVVDTYDVTHQLALVLERQLSKDPQWQGFQKSCSQSLWQLQKSVGAFLVPPRQRTKARYMNVAGHIAWAQNVLALLEGENRAELAKQLGLPEVEAGVWLEGKLGWLRSYAGAVGRYGRMMSVVRTVEAEVKRVGLGRQTAERIRTDLAVSGTLTADVSELVTEIMDYLKREGGKIPEGKQWLGSSDVIESLFGKYKVVSGRAPFCEVGASVLALAVLSVAWNAELVTEALQEVSNEDVQAWQQNAIGLSTLAKGHRVFAPLHHRSPPATPTQSSSATPARADRERTTSPEQRPTSGDTNPTGTP